MWGGAVIKGSTRTTGKGTQEVYVFFEPIMKEGLIKIKSRLPSTKQEVIFKNGIQVHQKCQHSFYTKNINVQREVAKLIFSSIFYSIVKIVVKPRIEVVSDPEQVHVFGLDGGACFGPTRGEST